MANIKNTENGHNLDKKPNINNMSALSVLKLLPSTFICIHLAEAWLYSVFKKWPYLSKNPKSKETFLSWYFKV